MSAQEAVNEAVRKGWLRVVKGKGQNTVYELTPKGMMFVYNLPRRLDK